MDPFLDGTLTTSRPPDPESPRTMGMAMEMASTVVRLMARDPGLRARWRRWLSARGWTVAELSSPSALPAVPSGPAGPWLLDAALLEDGDMPLVRRLSAQKMPVIVFGEGPAASDPRVVHWLEGGADDFIPAAVPEKVLVAKLEAHLRRIPPRLQLAYVFSPCRRIKADVERRLAWVRDDAGGWRAAEALTDTEFRILKLFLSAPNTLLRREDILEALWGDRADEVYSATLTQHVTSLRRKLGVRGSEIATVYGQGYMLREAA